MTPHGRRGDGCCLTLAALIADLRREAEQTGMRWLTDLADRYEAGITP